MRSPVFMAAVVVGVVAACDSSTISGPDPVDGAITFRLAGQSHAMSGKPASERGQFLNVSFAVAHADSVGGFAVIGYQRTGEGIGNLVVLQAPREVRTFTCPDETVPCDMRGAQWHGRYIMGVRNLGTADATRYFHIVSGTLSVMQLGPARLRGTFTAMFRAGDDQPDGSFEVVDGTIDVPFVTDAETASLLQCLLRGGTQCD